MKLLTKELEKKLPPLYATEKVPLEQKKLIVKYFTPFSNWTWYGVEYDPKEKRFFGLVVNGHGHEWGYFTLTEFEEINNSAKPPRIERDLYFSTTSVGDILARGY